MAVTVILASPTLIEPEALATRVAALPVSGEVRLNVRDTPVQAALSLESEPPFFATPIRSVVFAQVAESDVIAVVEELRPLLGDVHAWTATTRVPLAPPVVATGRRAHALANLAFIFRPDELPDEAWRAHWLGPHTHIAMETQATFGYLQHEVTAGLTEGAPKVAAIVEELFPPEAVSDMHAFYGSGGDDAELGRRLTTLMESVTTMGADRNITLVPTGRYIVAG